jgi:enterochelin esterase-like enzyme
LGRRGLLRGGVGGLGAVLLGSLNLSGCGRSDAQAAPAPGPTASASAITEFSFPSAVLGGTRYFKAYLPEGYDYGADLRYPVTCLLHGRNVNLSSWDRNKSMFDAMIAAGTVPPFIAAMPDAPQSDRGGYCVDSAYTNPSQPGFKNETGII